MLLVEDDAVTASALSAILVRRGFDVVRVDTVAAALLQLAGGFGVVILDLMLPDGDGTTVLQHIRATAGSQRVVVTTASNDPAKLAAVRSLSPEALLRKPIDLPNLLVLLARPN